MWVPAPSSVAVTPFADGSSSCTTPNAGPPTTRPWVGPCRILCIASDDHRTPALLDAARRAASVTHAVFVRILDVGSDEDVAYVVEEDLGEARTLAELVTDGGVPGDEVRRITGEVAAALESAGQRGMHHLDLKPDDVLRTPDGDVRLRGLETAAVRAGEDGAEAEDAARRDAVGVVALAYAGLTGLWPLRRRWVRPRCGTAGPRRRRRPLRDRRGSAPRPRRPLPPHPQRRPGPDQPRRLRPPGGAVALAPGRRSPGHPRGPRERPVHLPGCRERRYRRDGRCERPVPAGARWPVPQPGASGTSASDRSDTLEQPVLPAEPAEEPPAQPAASGSDPAGDTTTTRPRKRPLGRRATAATGVAGAAAAAAGAATASGSGAAAGTGATTSDRLFDPPAPPDAADPEADEVTRVIALDDQAPDWLQAAPNASAGVAAGPPPTVDAYPSDDGHDDAARAAAAGTGAAAAGAGAAVMGALGNVGERVGGLARRAVDKVSELSPDTAPRADQGDLEAPAPLVPAEPLTKDESKLALGIVVSFLVLALVIGIYGVSRIGSKSDSLLGGDSAAPATRTTTVAPSSAAPSASRRSTAHRGAPALPSRWPSSRSRPTTPRATARRTTTSPPRSTTATRAPAGSPRTTAPTPSAA